jgi:hypothetical protein
MPQRQPRLGDILDDYCTRERRLTNHAVVAMIGDEVKQTRCTTCDAEHEYKHARVPRQRKKTDAPAALYSQVLAGGPKHVTHETTHDHADHDGENGAAAAESPASAAESMAAGDDDAAVHAVRDEEPQERFAVSSDGDEADEESAASAGDLPEEGPVHRPLIRATLPRTEGQPPAQRPAPQFTIREPAGRPGRFRARHQRGPFAGNRSNGNGNIAGPMRSDSMRGGRPNQGGGAARPGRRHGHKRSK